MKNNLYLIVIDYHFNTIKQLVGYLLRHWEHHRALVPLLVEQRQVRRALERVLRIALLDDTVELRNELERDRTRSIRGESRAHTQREIQGDRDRTSSRIDLARADCSKLTDIDLRSA